MAIKYLNKPVFISALSCVFIFYSGFFKFPQRNPYISLISKDDVCCIYGQLLSSPSKTSSQKYYSSILEIYKTQNEKGFVSKCSGRISVYIPTEIVEAYYPGKLYSSANSSKSGKVFLETGAFCFLEGKFNAQGMFFANKCKESYWENNFLGQIDKFRALCRLQFKRLMFYWGEGGGLLLALLCGAREYTDFETAQAFKNAGLSHILALSGMHLSIFSAIALFIGKKLGHRKLSIFLKILMMLLFIWLVGLSPSLLRAFIFSMLTLFATVCGTDKPDLVIVLCFCFLLQCIISPSDIYNLGFILSYSALAGILLTGRFFLRLYTKLFPGRLALSLSSSTGAQIFTVPVSLKMFGSFCPIGIIAATVISPLITLFIYCGLVLIVLCLIFPVMAKPSAIFVNFLYNIIKSLAITFAKVPKWSLS